MGEGIQNTVGLEVGRGTGIGKRRYTNAAGERVVIAPDEGDAVLGGGAGFVGKLYVEEHGESFAVGEHPLGPGHLAAPHAQQRG